ncbi:class I poly(R)-hydroxyalkanoic acid synthase [Sulfitobacter sp. M57]|uniref:PHA/PHB synthase family protein n=1 Tax=unclassified Sulfitobacter TaxID=196795 RepID=UPI0023E32D36|nr:MULTISPECIES: class I poly(R)-hydroxyalkanoic acid synthase [unclassified Sulfitobacter]MDF3415075.1 class I poly(R)-hydroxyalkanoic acid synthase [Sulfitobacter sp. KE5]MDF3422556.1 class I poly(R)-hydroxyalkanoic acid synthase [Sulfitobacter sp. KE43]MDF3433621.1 class I poly(R)-hydroxyalkanoic acid synthase [Sulfitobacter sp. KE42]MDF3459261.1 class I poly(R)-hydroxyalkanoic acid synthase [Sulfitobacter sp. S74]MDF3463160.1 class I poly(R)-hydroxyalkanoic acid synthase [Sulfitobacter sp.
MRLIALANPVGNSAGSRTMRDDVNSASTTDIAEQTERLARLTNRAMLAAAQMQGHAAKQASGSEYQLMDAGALAKAYGTFWIDMMSDPAKLMDIQKTVATEMMAAWQTMLNPSDDAPVRDKRFKDQSWSDDPVARSYRDVFLAFDRATTGLLARLPDGSKDHQRVSFYSRQMVSALSPSNYLMTNPAARKALMETQGESLLAGLENLLADLERGDGRLDIATNDDTAFEVGVDLATTKGQVVFQNDLMQLIQYAPTTKQQHATPILFVPSWINKFYILDMKPENSLIRYMLDQGHSVFVVSWVNPTRDHAEKDFADYMTEGPLAALDVIRDITGEEKANILGFCIGGILVTAMLAYLAGIGDDRIASATTLASMVDFEDVGEIGVFIDDERLQSMRHHMAEKGYLDAHHLQDMFSMLRERDLIWSFVEANYLRGEKPPAFDLLSWNSDSTRLPSAMLLWYLEEVYLQNGLRKPGALELNGVEIDITKITTPCFILATELDHIAPWHSVYPATGLFGGEVEFVLGGSGHIAGVINPPAKRVKYGYRTSDTYPASPDDFQAQSTAHEGSWWPHWAAWLEARETKKVPARKPATKGKYKAIEAAPGSYVKSA